VVLVVVLLGLLEADLRRGQRVLGIGERLGLVEVGLDAGQDVAGAHDVAVAVQDRDDLPGDGALGISA